MKLHKKILFLVIILKCNCNIIYTTLCNDTLCYNIIANNSRDKMKIGYLYTKINIDTRRCLVVSRSPRSGNVSVLPFEVYQRHGLKLTVGLMRVMKFWWDSTGARRNQSTFCGLRDRSAGNSLSAIFEGRVQVAYLVHGHVGDG